MYCHYIGWRIRKCPLYRGVLYFIRGSTVVAISLPKEDNLSIMDKMIRPNVSGI